MSFDLCQVRQAEKPYYIENINTNIYSIEELCYYLYENMYLIDQTIVNEALCEWIRDELGLRRLYRQMMDHLEKEDGAAWFIMPIFREIGYLSSQQMKEYQEKLGKLEVQPEDQRQKLKGDYLVRCGMFSSAVSEYYQVLGRQGPGVLGSEFYSQLWNNLGCALARLFRFEEASECFYQGWKLTRTKEMLRKYVSTLPLFLDNAEYENKLRRLGADNVLIRRIQEYNTSVCDDAVLQAGKWREQQTDPKETLKQLMEDYRRNA